MPQAAEHPLRGVEGGHNPQSHPRSTSVARRESPPPTPTAGRPGQPGGEGATELLNRVTAELLCDGRPGRSPHPPRPDAAEG